MARRKILVPLDFQSKSDMVLHSAREMATKMNAMISFMYVIEVNEVNVEETLNFEEKRKVRRDAENKLSAMVGSVFRKEDNTPFEIIITTGEVHQKIIEKSIDLKAEIIVIGRSNSKEHKKNDIGSNTKKVIEKSQIPVIVICSNRIIRGVHVIVPLDLLKLVGFQVNCAVQTANIMEATVSVISVIEKERISLKPKYLKSLKQIKMLFEDFNIECSTHLIVMQTSVSAEILSFSNKIDSGMILLMNTQKKGGAGTKPGTVVREVLAESEVHVQCINKDYIAKFPLDDSGLILSSDSLSLVP